MKAEGLVSDPLPNSEQEMTALPNFGWLSVHSLEKANRGSVVFEGIIFWLPEVHFKKFSIFLTLELL